jgi:hypothetical protein
MTPSGRTSRATVFSIAPGYGLNTSAKRPTTASNVSAASRVSKSPWRKDMLCFPSVLIRFCTAATASGALSIPQNFAAVADEFRHDQRGVARSAPNVQHPHALRDAGILEELPCDGIDELSLKPEALQFSIGMAKLVFLSMHELLPSGHRMSPPDFAKFRLIILR